MTRVLVLAAVVAAAAALLGSCEKNAEKPKAVTIQVSYENNPGDPIDLSVNEWKRLAEERSRGTLVLQLFPSSQLGSKGDAIGKILAGSPLITLADGAYYADLGVPDLGIVFGPYLFSNWDETFKLTKSLWWAQQMAKLEAKGMKVLTSNWIYGDRHLLTRKPIRSVSDLKGLKLRVPNNSIQIKGMESLGVVATPMPLSEVYAALQRGSVDGLENPVPVLYSGMFHEIAKFLTLDGHVKNFTTWLTGVHFFNTLSQEQQKILMETGDLAGLFCNDLQMKVVDDIIDKMKASGVEVITVNQADFKKAASKFYTLPEFSAKWTPGLYETVKEAMR